MNPHIDILMKRLRALESQISSQSTLSHPSLSGSPEWRGAGVRVACRPPEDRCNFWDADELLVLTPHSRALTCLLLEVRDAFGDRVDWINKYEFYGTLAEAALAHIDKNGFEKSDYRPLLLAVLSNAISQAAIIDSGMGIPTQQGVAFDSFAWPTEPHTLNFNGKN